MAEQPSPRARAHIDFVCLDHECGETIQFDLMELEETRGRVSCPTCHRLYQFDAKFLDKLRRFKALMVAIREAEDMLGDVNVGITTPMGEERIPYRLLLTRLNTTITLDVGGRTVDFRFRVEPITHTIR